MHFGLNHYHHKSYNTGQSLQFQRYVQCVSIPGHQDDTVDTAIAEKEIVIKVIIFVYYFSSSL